MIYGMIPIGGKGTRLGLPYSKEMLPQKNFDYFNPLVNHIVEKMHLAGAEKIYFIHGWEFKKDVVEYFKEERYIHVLQEKLGFANVIADFYRESKIESTDRVLFGLPDSVFDENPFVELVDKKGIVAGLFVTDPISKVDRLDTEQQNFQVKSSKTEDNLDLFWGVLKFDGADLTQMVSDNVFDLHTEIGNILNLYKKTYVICKSYLDLGTWSNYNRYLSSTYNFSNIEVEKKYDAEGVNPGDFIAHFQDRGGKLLEITSTDHYHVSNNSNIEFIRYRGNSEDGTIPSPDITIKNYNKSQLNRFELVVPLSPDADSKNVLHFLKLLGANHVFSVTKKCYIFTFEEYTAVYYEFNVNDKLFKIIEIELHKIDFNIISKLEVEMTAIPGFNPMLTISKSKFQIIKEQLS
jgi:hypothetical protein